MCILRFEGVWKSYQINGQAQPVLRGVSLDVKEGEVLGLLGANGSGKTTIISLAAGILQPDEGRVECRASMEAGDLGLVFQQYEASLLPWRTCRANIALPLEVLKVGRRSRWARVESLMAELEVDLPLDRYPYELSGGQKQLTALARALIRKPRLLLLDEPFGSLDYPTRIAMQRILQRAWGKERISVVFVTHELEESILLSDRIIVLSRKEGSILAERDIPFRRPRPTSLVASKEFAALKGCLLQHLEREGQ